MGVDSGGLAGLGQTAGASPKDDTHAVEVADALVNVATDNDGHIVGSPASGTQGDERRRGQSAVGVEFIVARNGPVGGFGIVGSGQRQRKVEHVQLSRRRTQFRCRFLSRSATIGFASIH